MKLFDGAHFRSSLKHFLIGRAAQGILSIILTLVTIRVMNQYEYGIYLVLLGIIDLMRPLSSLGILPTMQQFLPEMALHASVAQLNDFIRITKLLRWILLGILSIVLYFVWGPICGWLNIPPLSQKNIYLLCLLVFFVLSLEYSESTLEAILEQKFSQFARMLHTSTRLFAIIFLGFLSKADVENILLFEVIAALISLLFSEIYLHRKVATLNPNGSKHFTFSEIYTFGLHLSISQLMYVAATPGSLRLIVLKLIGVEAAGQFGFMQTLLLQINRLMPSLLLVNLIRPMLIAARSRGQINMISDATGLIYKTNMFLVWPLIPLSLLFGDVAMEYLSGGQLKSMGLAMTFMMLVLSANTQSQVSSVVLQVFKKSKWLALSGLLSLLSPILLVFGSFYSINYACLSLFVASALNYAAVMILIQTSVFRVHLDSKGIVKFGMVLLIALLVGIYFKTYSDLTGFIAFCSILLIYVIFGRPFTEYEFKVLDEAFPKKLGFLKFFVSKDKYIK